MIALFCPKRNVFHTYMREKQALLATRFLLYKQRFFQLSLSVA